MSWFEVKGGHLRFRGRTTRHPVADWMASDEGAKAIDAAAGRMGFSLLGRKRAARRGLGRELQAAVASRSASEAIAAACEHYVGAWTQLAYAPPLPRVTIGLQRLVVVPRIMIVVRTMAAAGDRLVRSLGIAGAAEPFSVFFSRWIVREIDVAVRHADPSPRRPVHARESWACVALDNDEIWIDPGWYGPDSRGHVVLYEMPARGLQRRDRKQLEAAIAQSMQAVKSLTRLERDGTVRVAGDQMETLTFGRV